MSLVPGDRVGPYEIVAAVGAGGMLEVYRARDSKLQRDVAIKILPELFAADPDRRARFDREAQTLAALNHPNIAHIHGVEANALVMEFVDGEDLAGRLARGPVPLDEAMPIARQIADALQAAHERGIVHRDLKPANVMVRPDGTVKVLDFGLAKLGALDASAAIATSPTFTSPAMMTHAGIIIGTAAYMAPEQAKGKPVDRRADLWALGVVLYEMLTGRAAFEGETITDVLAAVVTRDPDWSALPPQTPPALRRLLARCLARDPRRRLADAGEAAYQIDEAMNPTAESVPAIAPGGATFPRPRRLRAAMPWAVAVVTFFVAVGLLWRQSQAAPAAILRYTIGAPPKTTVELINRPALAISRDGSTVAFVGTAKGVTRLYVHRQTEFESRVLEGTEGASEPVFSPDGRWIAFFAGYKLGKIPVDGGPVETLAPVSDPRGLGWDTDDAILYAPDSTTGLFQLSPTRGSTPRSITTLTEKVERSHRWPQMLRNGTILFTVGSLTSPDNYDDATIEAVIPKTGERRVVVKSAAMARYVEPGYLLFARGGSLFSAAFDQDTLQVKGTPIAVATGIGGDTTTGASSFVYSPTGTFAYVGGQDDARKRLAWADRTGRLEAVDLPPAGYLDVKLSPDGRRAAVIVVGSGGSDVWVYDFARKTFTRLTFGGSHRTPVWSADGTVLYYIALAPNGGGQVMRKPADGSGGEEHIVTAVTDLFLRDVSPDGRIALIDYLSGANRTDIATLPLQAGASVVPVVATQADECCPALSPDRRWMAYQSDETSRSEIYVRAASGQGGRWQISTSGGEEAHWSADGRELYFWADTQLMVARVDPGATFQFSLPQVLFEGRYHLRSDSGLSFDVEPKGARFLTLQLGDDSPSIGAIRVIVNWAAELRQLMRGS